MNPDYYIDTFSAIKNKKSTSHFPLYFKTDTHWNELGASIAFDALAKKSSEAGDPIIWPSKKLDFRFSPAVTGDLSRFQRSCAFLNENDVRITAASLSDINIVESSYINGKTLYAGKNIPIAPSTDPLIIKSPQALNKKRVVWLRDSFGTAMSRMMAQTFSETLQIHHGRVKPSDIKKIITDYKPEYVIVTVVERNSMSKMFKYHAID